MRSPSPAFQFYPKDWLSDGSVRAMTHEERGVYVELLSICWLEDGLPAEIPRLARLVSVPPKRFERLWSTIGPCFQEKDGRLSQKRLDEEKSKQLAYRDLQSRKGKKGGKSHAISKDNKPRLTRGLTGGQAEAKPEQSIAVPSSLPLSLSQNDNGNGVSPADAGAPQGVELVKHVAGEVAAFENQRRPGPQSWSTEACDDWAEFMGPAPGNVIGKALKPVVAKHGWDVIRPLWRQALEDVVGWDDPGRFTAWVFVRQVEALIRRANGEARAGPSSPRARARENSMRAMVAGGLKGDGTVGGRR